MRTHAAHRWIVLAAFSLAASGAVAAPQTVRISYAAYMNGLPIGSISESFEADGRAYRIVSETKPVGIAVLIQRQPLMFVSRGYVTRNGLRPLHFEGRRTPDDPPQVAAEFDWKSAHITLRHNGRSESLPLAGGTQDRLSVMYQFMFTRPDQARHVRFWMTNGRKLDRYVYAVTPEVELDTALGRLKTVHLVKQRDPGDSAAEVWLSPRHHHLPVKLTIVEKDGLRFEQVVQSIDVRD